MNHIPEGYHSVLPSFTVRDASAAMAFCIKAFPSRPGLLGLGA